MTDPVLKHLTETLLAGKLATHGVHWKSPVSDIYIEALINIPDDIGTDIVRELVFESPYKPEVADIVRMGRDRVRRRREAEELRRLSAAPQTQLEPGEGKRIFKEAYVESWKERHPDEALDDAPIDKLYDMITSTNPNWRTSKEPTRALGGVSGGGESKKDESTPAR